MTATETAGVDICHMCGARVCSEDGYLYFDILENAFCCPACHQKREEMAAKIQRKKKKRSFFHRVFFKQYLDELVDEEE